jgi:NADPH-dependent glutamate synthase beta subunit-like oxidoreductase
MAQAESRGIAFQAACETAFYLLADLNPLPASCARVCPHQCEARCSREQVDAPVAINALERFLGDFALERKLPLRRDAGVRQAERVAVIGSGPGGLSCAYQLARRGYPVSLFEGFPRPGGMLRYGTPAFRLPREVLEAEVARLLALGIELRTGPVPSLEQIRREHAAVFVGIRASEETRLGLPGQESGNVLSAIQFLHRVNGGEPFEPGPSVAVIGGGDVALDAARTAVRLGGRATLLAGRAAGSLPCSADAAREAEAEGVVIQGPVKVLGVATEGAWARGLACVRLADDGAGLRPVAGSEFSVEASTIIVAAKPERDLRGLASLLAPDGTLRTDEQGETAAAGTFAAGDDLELSIVSTAIFRGRRAAEIIHARLRGSSPASADTGAPITREAMRLGYYPKRARAEAAAVPAAERLRVPWAEATLTLAEDQAAAEAARCLSCGLCFACDTCWKYCQEQAIVRPSEKGQPYRLKLEFCTGCKKCAEECPCGYIEMR